MSGFDTAVMLPDGKLYVFASDRVSKYALAAGRVQPCGSSPISAAFPGAFPRNVDAALLHPDGSLYLFRGKQHIRYSLAARRPFAGYPRPYATDWPGVFPDGIDAAITWSPEVIYFFADDGYTSFSPRDGRTRRGYPKPLRANWPGLTDGPLNAAFVATGDRRVLVTRNGPLVVDHEGEPRGWVESGLPTALRDYTADVATVGVQLQATSSPSAASVRRRRLHNLKPGFGDVFVLIPEILGSTPDVVDVLLHYHGFGCGYQELKTGQKDFAGVLKPGQKRDLDLYHLDVQLDAITRANRRLTIAVLPQGGQHSTFEDLQKAPFSLLRETMRGLVAEGTWTHAPRLGNVVISGHSGAGPTAREVARRMAAPRAGFGRLAGLLLFDAVHGPARNGDGEIGAMQTWLLKSMGADVTALRMVSADADVDAYFAARPRFRGYCSTFRGYCARYARLQETITAQIRKANTTGLTSHAVARLSEQYQVVGPIGPRAADPHAVQWHERLLGEQNNRDQPGIVFEALAGLSPAAIHGAAALPVQRQAPPPANPVSRPFKTEKYVLSPKAVVLVRAAPSKHLAEIAEAPDHFAAAILTNARLDAEKWFRNFTRVTFLGRPIETPVHTTLAAHLRRLEETLARNFGGPDADVAIAASRLGLSRDSGQHFGARVSPTSAALSMHLFGLAIDLNYTANPFVGQPHALVRERVVFKSAGLLVTGTAATFEYQQESQTTSSRFTQLSALNTILTTYFSYLDPAHAEALSARLDAATARPWRTAGKRLTNAAAVTHIRADLRTLAGLWNRSTPDRLRVIRAGGFLGHKRELVEGMAMDWGGSYGDMMHFDLRGDGADGARIQKEIQAYRRVKVRESGEKFKRQPAVPSI